jgi:hypothetical protein
LPRFGLQRGGPGTAGPPVQASRDGLSSKRAGEDEWEVGHSTQVHDVKREDATRSARVDALRLLRVIGRVALGRVALGCGPKRAEVRRLRRPRGACPSTGRSTFRMSRRSQRRTYIDLNQPMKITVRTINSEQLIMRGVELWLSFAAALACEAQASRHARDALRDSPAFAMPTDNSKDGQRFSDPAIQKGVRD